MKILVTGGCGFIGSNLVRLLIREGHSVVSLDKLTYAANAASLADLAQHPDYYFEYCDLASPINKRESPPSHLSTFAPRDRRSRSEDGSHCGQKSLTEIFNHYQPDAVMHLAAESHVDRSIDGPGEFIQTNIVGTYNLLQASLEYWKSLPVTDPRSEIRDSSDPASRIPYPVSRIPYPVSQKSFRFLHVSTDEVYGSLASDVPGFSETTPYDPHSPYSASKAASDHLARAWCDTYGLPVLVTNCSNNYGPYQFPEKLTPLVILKCLRGEPIPIYGKGENIRDWLYVEDHAEALYAVLTKGRVGETYNIGGDNERQNIELVKMICGLMEEFRGPAVNQGSADIPVRQSEPGREQSANDQGHSKHGLASDLCRLSSDKRYESLITFVTDRPGHDRRYAIDASKVRDELGWEPKEDSESGFRKTVRWYLENRHWWENILNGEYKLERMGKA